MNQRINYPDVNEFETHLIDKNFQADNVRAYCADVRQDLDWLVEREIAAPFAASTLEAREYVTFLTSPLHTPRHGKPERIPQLR